MDVTVCIVNWNCREILRACLETLEEKTQGVRLEVIVVDNGSVDGAADMVDTEFPEVRLLRNPSNLGFSRANNLAAGEAHGRHLFFLNNDTRVPPSTLRRLVDFLEANPEVGMVGPRLRDARGHLQVSYRPRPSLAVLLHRTCLWRWTGLFRKAYQRYRRGAFQPAAARDVDILMGAAVLLRRHDFQHWGGWDEDFFFGGEDMELSHRVNRHARVVFFPGAEVIHLGRAGTRQNSAPASLHIAVGTVLYLRKTGCSRPGILLFKAAMTLDAPAQVLLKGTQYLWRRALGQKKKAAQSKRVVQAFSYFLLRGLIPFWKS